MDLEKIKDFKDEIKNSFITKDEILLHTGHNHFPFISVSTTHCRFSLNAIEVMDLKNGEEVCFQFFELDNDFYINLHQANFIDSKNIATFKLTSHKHGRLEFRSSQLRNYLQNKLDRNDYRMIYFYCLDPIDYPFTYVYSSDPPREYYGSKYKSRKEESNE